MGLVVGVKIMFVRPWILALAPVVASLAQDGGPGSAVVKTAESGDPAAQMSLAFMYFYRTDGIPQNHSEGIRWARKAAEQGLVEAQSTLGFWLGIYPEWNKDVAPDYPEAAKWFKRAAEQGDAVSQKSLGLFYKSGQGVQQDDREAVKWFRAAAEQGLINAQENLAMMYRDGRGVPQDYVSAHMWANLAAAQGTAVLANHAGVFPRETVEQLRRSRAELREEIVRLMTPDQIAEAQDRAQRWKPKGDSATSQERKSEPDSVGTGFWINRQGHILTNQHVVDECSSIFVAGPGGRQKTRVIVSDPANDLAVVGPVGQGANIISLSENRSSKLGQGVVAVGFPLQGLLSSGISLTTGTVSALAGIQNDARMIQITAPVQSGNSGGPLLDHSGNLIGVVTSSLDSLKVAATTGDVPQNVNFAIKGAIVRTFLESNEIPYSARPSGAPIETTAIAEQVKKAVAIVECWK